MSAGGIEGRSTCSAGDDLAGAGLFQRGDDRVELAEGAGVLLGDAGQAGVLGVGDELAGFVALAAVLGEEVGVVMKNRQSRQGLAYSQSVWTGAPQ